MGSPGTGGRLLPALEESWVEVDGRPVRSFSGGRQTGLPEIVLVPGMGAAGYLYPWMRQASTWTRTTVLDLPGWRGGPGRSSASTVAALAVAAAHWLEVTGRQPVVLAGHSSGAQSAVRTALVVPDRLVGLVLAGPTLDPRARHLPVLLSRTVGTVAREKLAELPAVMPWYTRSGGLPWLRLAWTAVRYRPEDVLTDVRAPVLVITGERDRFAPPAWAQRLACLGRAPCVLVPGAHNACFTSPVATDEAVHRAVSGWTRDEGAVPPAGG